jgi:enamine deaminase RidA (YjgF/YER057c/UK114 family)
MLKSVALTLFLLSLVSVLVGIALAQVPAPAGGFERKSFTYENFSKGRFSDVVTISGPARLIFLAGSAAYDAENGTPLYRDNFLDQCRYAYAKVKKLLAEQGATMNDIVRQTAYIVDARNQADYGKCRAEAFQGATLPASTGVYVSALAFPYMLFEVEVTAAVAR